jgi:hypothetical protein
LNTLPPGKTPLFEEAKAPHPSLFNPIDSTWNK